MWRSNLIGPIRMLMIGLSIVLMTSCGSPRYQCNDHRATYFDTDGRVLRGSRGITEGFVLIPAAGDAGSFMLGRYVRISHGAIVERFSDTPEPVQKNFVVPFMKELERQNRATTSGSAP